MGLQHGDKKEKGQEQDQCAGIASLEDTREKIVQRMHMEEGCSSFGYVVSLGIISMIVSNNVVLCKL